MKNWNDKAHSKILNNDLSQNKKNTQEVVSEHITLRLRQIHVFPIFFKTKRDSAFIRRSIVTYVTLILGPPSSL